MARKDIPNLYELRLTILWKLLCQVVTLTNYLLPSTFTCHLVKCACIAGKRSETQSCYNLKNTEYLIFLSWWHLNKYVLFTLPNQCLIIIYWNHNRSRPFQTIPYSSRSAHWLSRRTYLSLKASYCNDNDNISEGLYVDVWNVKNILIFVCMMLRFSVKYCLCDEHMKSITLAK